MNVLVSGPVNMNGKRALVVGGAGEIGQAVVNSLVREGATVIVSDIKDIKKVERKHEKSRVLGFQCDITNEGDINKLKEFVVKEINGIDVLIYVAGIMHSTVLEQIEIKEWNLEFSVNVTGAFLCCQKFIPLMKEQKYGKIVIISSVAGKIGGIFSGPHYAATKAALHGFIKWVARDGAPHGIYVNCIAPGPIKTKMISRLEIKDDAFPLKRIGQPEDVAEAVIFLTSQASNWITGTVLDVNGGMLMD